jgi:hypothetical protein
VIRPDALPVRGRRGQIRRQTAKACPERGASPDEISRLVEHGRAIAGASARNDSTARRVERGRMQKRGLLLVALVLVAMVGCAKKMLPPSPDRFRPHLQEVETRTRSQVVLVFDEAIDGARLSPDSFLMTGPAGETLVLRGASLGRGGDEVQLWTPIQEQELYEVRGVVRDRAGNPARVRARFRGSTRRDTIAPRIARVEPGPGSTRQKRGVKVRVSFSEAIDTSGVVDWMFVPAAYDTQFKRSWTTDWQVLSFTRLESMPSGAIVYFLARPRVADLEGNPAEGVAFTYFTSDTLLEAVSVKGNLARYAQGRRGFLHGVRCGPRDYRFPGASPHRVASGAHDRLGAGPDRWLVLGQGKKG